MTSKARTAATDVWVVRSKRSPALNECEIVRHREHLGAFPTHVTVSSPPTVPVSILLSALAFFFFFFSDESVA